ncbi:MAG: hypothetical protein JSV00_07110 [bacterium]|nr:MAG: hypothetical protein JSV00_07110 [bacterium]
MRERYFTVGPGAEASGDSHGFRVGSETCARLLPGPGRLSSLAASGDPAGLTLVTPLAGPDEVDRVLEAISQARSEGWGEVVVNDWGILREVSARPGADITAGRLLLRLRRGPGSLDDWDGLDGASRRYFAWGPLYDRPFLDFLGRQGVARLELDPPRHWLPVPSPDGFRLSMHCDTRLISVLASCPWLPEDSEGQGAEPRNCEKPCTEGGPLAMRAAALEHPLRLCGRAILERVRLPVGEEDLPDRVDRLIYDPFP